MDDRCIIETLYAQYTNKGFILEHEVLHLFAENNVPLSNVDSLTEHLLLRGVIIKADEADEEEYDRGKIDFEALYEDIILADPSLRNYIDYVRQIQPPQRREWQRLFPMYKEGSRYAHNRLFEMYLRSVAKIAYSYYQRLRLPLADTIQEGNIGLLLAFEKYEMAEHEALPKYYPMWVMQSIMRNRSFSPNPLVYFPVNVKDRLYKIYDHIEAAGGATEADLSSPVLLKSVMEEMGCTAEEAKHYLRFFEPIFSIEELLGAEANIFSDDGMLEEGIIDTVDKVLLRDTVRDYLSQLKPKEANILELRYGLRDDSECTLEEAGKKFGVTRERIRQIEATALKRLCHSTRIDKLRAFFCALG